MTYLLSAIAAAICIVGLPWGLYVLTLAAIDGHRRGLARVHRGTSWSPRDRKEAA